MPVLDIQKLTPPLEEFLTKLLAAARMDLKFQIQANGQGASEPEEPEIIVNFSGEDTDLLLMRGGELLSALEDLATRVLHLSASERGRIAFDCDEYKMLRLEELRLTAATAAERALATGMPFSLNPMNARDRRIIHLSLKENPSVRTESQGFGPHRKVVIFPAENKPTEKG